jgi:hypothetical protein
LLGLGGIKRKILVFGLLATLIPSLTIAWILDAQNSNLITEKTSEELRVSSLQTSREVDIWLKQRIYDLRVFSSSYEVSENLQKSTGRRTSTDALERLKSYLTSVKEKFSDYEELMVTDPEGHVVTTSAGRGRSCSRANGGGLHTTESQFWERPTGTTSPTSRP